MVGGWLILLLLLYCCFNWFNGLCWEKIQQHLLEEKKDQFTGEMWNFPPCRSSRWEAGLQTSKSELTDEDKAPVRSLGWCWYSRSANLLTPPALAPAAQIALIITTGSIWCQLNISQLCLERQILTTVLRGTDNCPALPTNCSLTPINICIVMPVSQ